jgi:hypothetical protein
MPEFFMRLYLLHPCYMFLLTAPKVSLSQ